MKIEYFIIGLLFIHFIADFVFQTDRQARGKSSDVFILTEHVFTYGISLLIGVGLLTLFAAVYIGPAFTPPYGVGKAFGFVFVNMAAHWITDFYTSRVNKNLWEDGNRDDNLHSFFAGIGFDQFLHQAALIVSAILILF